METLIVSPKNEDEMATVEAVLEALKVSFERQKKDGYNADFVEKIKASIGEVEAGKTTEIKPADIWNLG